jgi:translation elongation factor EF-Tu-like GTPase
MTVVDVSVTAARGTVFTGTIKAGAVAVNTTVTIERVGRPPLVAEVAAIEVVRRKAERAGTGNSVDVLLRGIVHVAGTKLHLVADRQ